MSAAEPALPKRSFPIWEYALESIAAVVTVVGNHRNERQLGKCQGAYRFVQEKMQNATGGISLTSGAVSQQKKKTDVNLSLGEERQQI